MSKPGKPRMLACGLSTLLSKEGPFPWDEIKLLQWVLCFSGKDLIKICILAKLLLNPVLIPDLEPDADDYT